jgi:hypothetical protein
MDVGVVEQVYGYRKWVLASASERIGGGGSHILRK